MRFFTCDRASSPTRDKAFRYYVTSKISENIHTTPEGFLVCVGVPIARTGEMLYGEDETPLEGGKNGQVVIDRAESEVFRPETIASFEGKAITITHPEEFVDPTNWKRLAVGVLQNVRRGEGDEKNDLIADLLVTDGTAINLVKNGLREVSCGYEADWEQTDEGRGVQSNIIGNHLALVEQGRAGSGYAINDHKGVMKMKLADKIKAIFAKAQDEAMKVAADESSGEKPVEGKESKAADAPAAGYDELVKMVKDLGEKVGAMAKPKDAASPAEAGAGEKPAPADDEGEASMEDRMKALEASVAKILESIAAKAGDEESEEGEAADADEDEAEDDDFEESAMVGDTASRVEILAPGMDAKGKDAKKKALQTAYATKDGKRVIEALTGGKAPAFDSAEKVDTLFVAASELLKVQRTADLSKTRQAAGDSAGQPARGPMSAEEMNEINAKHYRKQA